MNIYGSSLGCKILARGFQSSGQGVYAYQFLAMKKEGMYFCDTERERMLSNISENIYYMADGHDNQPDHIKSIYKLF